jgi:hypothetical protein
MSSRRGRGLPPSKRGGGGQWAGGEGRGPRPQPYEQKFADFIRLCEERKGQEGPVSIKHPEVIGDNYAELVESLSRLADAGLDLHVAERSARRQATAPSPHSGPGGGSDRPRSLPRPTVSSPEGDDDPSKFGAAGVMGMVINPIYAGGGGYPQLVPDAQWVAAARRALEQDGPDQFLVNVLYVLRRTFGCVEWGGDLPPDTN